MSDKERRMYLGSSIDNIEKTKLLIHSLGRHNWRITHDWTIQGVIEQDHLLSAHAIAMLHGVMRADVVGIILPGGRGTHVELGAAIATNKPCILFADNFELLKGKGTSGRVSCFYRHPLVHTVGTQDEFIQIADLLFQSYVGRP